MARIKHCLFYITTWHLPGMIEISTHNLNKDGWNLRFISAECDWGAGAWLAGINVHKPHVHNAGIRKSQGQGKIKSIEYFTAAANFVKMSPYTLYLSLNESEHVTKIVFRLRVMKLPTWARRIDRSWWRLLHSGIRVSSGQVYCLQLTTDQPKAKHVFRRICKIAKNDYWLHRVCLSVCLSVRMERFGSHWTDFHRTWFSNIFQKYD